MKNITAFDKENINALREELNRAIAPVCEKYGITGLVDRASYDNMEVKFTLLASIGDDKAKWERNAAPLGLPTDALGKAIQVNGVFYQIFGIDISGRVAKVLVGHGTERYTMSVADVKRCLGVSTEPAEKVEPYNSATFDLHARLAGIHGKIQFKQRFSYLGVEYEVVDVKPKSPKYPILARELRSGKEYKFTLDSVLEEE